MTMTLVSTVTVGAGGATSIAFTGIPQTGTDLLIRISSRNSGGVNAALISFNSSTTGFSARRLFGSGSTVSSNTYTDNRGFYTSFSTDTAGTFGNCEIYIPNYSGSTNKSYSSDSVSENNAAAAYQALIAGLWSNTAAITSISLYPTSGNFDQYSTASLYTITKGSGGATVS